LIDAILRNPLAATLIRCVWSLVFYYVWFLKFSWNVFRIPVGMTIIVYPFFFSLPIILLAGGCELAVEEAELEAFTAQRAIAGCRSRPPGQK
jgi:hypothetical protein